jgi:nitroreductase/NAD-dependent dihydropyrimidine dehydrogenase PreA subunit
MPELSVNPKTCTRCGMCVKVCPVRVIRLPHDGTPLYALDGASRCILCGHCQAVCPSGSITVDDQRLSPTVYEGTDAEIDPMLLGAYLRMRRSIRSYREAPVERATIEQVMDIVRYAPSSTNSQTVRWLIIYDTQEVRRLTGMAVDWMRDVVASKAPISSYFNFDGIVRAWDEGDDLVCRMAPHLVVAYAHKDAVAAGTDAIIALSHLEVAAPAFGLGTCWGGFIQLAISQWEPLRAALNLPPGHVSIYAMMLGYPQFRYLRPPRRNPVDITWRA